MSQHVISIELTIAQHSVNKAPILQRNEKVTKRSFST